jgi:hypothetical protein
MYPETISTLSRWRGRRAVAVLLSVAVTALGVPFATASGATPGNDGSLPRLVLIRNGDGLFRIDLSDVVANLDAVAAGAGSMTVSVEKARFAGEGPGEEVPIFAFDDPDGPSTADFDILASGSTADVLEWRPVVTATATGTPWSASVEIRVGADVMTVTVPRDMLGEDGLPIDVGPVEVTVNGAAWQADPEFVARAARLLSEEGVVPGIEAPEGLLDLVESFHDRGRFVHAAAGLELILGALVERFGDPGGVHRPAGCFLPCFGCGVALGGYGLSLVGLIAACGATAGAMCIVAFVGLTLGKFGVANACIGCGKCMSPPKEVQLGDVSPELELDDCPCKGEPNCDCM